MWSCREIDTDSAQPLAGGDIVKLVSWKLTDNLPDPAARASAAVNYLSSVFGEAPERLVLMLQSIHPGAYKSLRGHEWIRSSFSLSNIERPNKIQAKDGERKVLWRPKDQSTVMLLSNDLPLIDCFQVPLPTRFGCDALMDVPILHDKN